MRQLKCALQFHTCEWSSFFMFIALFFPIVVTLPKAEAAVEFLGYRLQHFDIQGIRYGSRSSAMNFEAQSIDSQHPNRKCIVLSINEFSSARFLELVQHGAGSILIIIPNDFTKIDQETKENILTVEKFFLSRNVDIPVYFLKNSTKLQTFYGNIIHNTIKETPSSSFQALANAVSSTGYHVTVHGSLPKLHQNSKVANIQGKIHSYGLDGQLPTIAVVAYYDSFGASSELSFGADSNGSGVAALLELARLFSLMNAQANHNTQPFFNLIFLLSGGGKLNYLGSKKFLDDQLDSLDGNLLQETHFVLCLDAIANNQEINIHVSKLPKDGSSIGQFVENLRKIAAQIDTNVKINVVPKKINLAEDFLAWEHERYSVRRLSAMTASHFKHPRNDILRGSVLDIKPSVNVSVLSRNVRILAEALATELYKSEGHFFVDNLSPSYEFLDLWMDILSNQSRSYPAIAGGSSKIVSMLQLTLQSYLTDIKITHLIADKRDPEYGFYDQTSSPITIYSVKPALFDLFLSLLIGGYLTFIFYVVQSFNLIYVITINFCGAKRLKCS